MPRQLHHLTSSFEIALNDLEAYFDNNPNLPDGVESVEFTRKNSTITITSEASDESISKYVPTCSIKGTVSERRVYPEDSTSRDRYDEENPGELIEFACFKGDIETVLVNTELRPNMFELLCTLAEQARCGDLEAIYTTDDNTLESTLIEDGIHRNSRCEVVSNEPDTNTDPDGVSWTDNQFIQQ